MCVNKEGKWKTQLTSEKMFSSFRTLKFNFIHLYESRRNYDYVFLCLHENAIKCR